MRVAERQVGTAGALIHCDTLHRLAVTPDLIRGTPTPEESAHRNVIRVLAPQAMPGRSIVRQIRFQPEIDHLPTQFRKQAVESGHQFGVIFAQILRAGGEAFAVA